MVGVVRYSLVSSCMVLKCPKWLHVVLNCPIWLCFEDIVFLNVILSCMALHGVIWSCVDPYGSVLPNWVLYGPVWLCMASWGSLQSCLALLWSLWLCIGLTDLYCLVLPHLVTSEPVWSWLVFKWF